MRSSLPRRWSSLITQRRRRTLALRAFQQVHQEEHQKITRPSPTRSCRLYLTYESLTDAVAEEATKLVDPQRRVSQRQVHGRQETDGSAAPRGQRSSGAAGGGKSTAGRRELLGVKTDTPRPRAIQRRVFKVDHAGTPSFFEAICR